MRHLLDLSHSGSSELAQLTNSRPPQPHSCYLGSPRVFWGVLSVLTLCRQRQNQRQPGLLPAGAPLSQSWRSRREDAFELQLPEPPSPTTHLPKYKMVSGLMAPSRWT